MQHRCSLWLTATVLIYLSVHISSVHGSLENIAEIFLQDGNLENIAELSLQDGKCRGKWRSHVCYGGNGKRSGPPITDRDDEKQGLLLKRILYESSDPVSDNYNGLDELYPTLVQTNDDSNLSNDKQEWTKQDLQKLSDLVQEYLYRKRLRALTDEAGLV